jgi:hypothetical protein
MRERRLLQKIFGIRLLSGVLLRTEIKYLSLCYATWLPSVTTPDLGRSYEYQMLRASTIENDLHAISTVGERIAVGSECAGSLQPTKNAAIAVLRWFRGMAGDLPFGG